jgi:hypothetical protein
MNVLTAALSKTCSFSQYGIQWLLRQQESGENRRVGGGGTGGGRRVGVQGDGHLTIRDLDVEDAGTYTCQIRLQVRIMK